MQLAQRLVSTLDEQTEAGVKELWFVEAERRLDELRTGKVEGISAEDAFKDARETLAR